MILKRAFERPEVIAALRPLGGLIPGAVDPEQAAALRRRKLKRFEIAHRGRYSFCDLPRDPALHRFAEQLFEVPLDASARPRLFRLARGDYSLVLDDARTRIERGVELTLDLSARATGEGNLVYGEREVPQQPGLLAAVFRNAATSCYQRYLPHSVGSAVIYRLRVAYPAR